MHGSWIDFFLYAIKLIILINDTCIEGKKNNLIAKE